jgi:hypothetical protein
MCDGGGGGSRLDNRTAKDAEQKLKACLTG